MENNWKDKIAELIASSPDNVERNVTKKDLLENEDFTDIALPIILNLMNLVFEATKKECADKAETVVDCIGSFTHVINKESILNINKPNL